MPRQPRLNIADGVYHVTQRGLERRNIVLNDADRHDWWRLFDRQATRCGWRVFALALLDNHFHIFLRTPQPNLSAGMHAFESGFVTLFNRRHARTGPLFQGRFGAVLVEYETHARVLSRYVHLNPHRAGLDPQPGQYRWCSYRYYLNPNGAPGWLDWRTVLGEVSSREGAARIAYRRFVEEGSNTRLPSPLADVTEDGLLGSAEFVRRYTVRGQAPQISDLAGSCRHQEQSLVPPNLKSAVPDPTLFDRLVRAVAVEFDVPIEQIRQRGRHGNWARHAVIWLTHGSLKWTHLEIAERLGDLSESAVRDSLRRTRLRFDEPQGGAFRAGLANAARSLGLHES